MRRAGFWRRRRRRRSSRGIDGSAKCNLPLAFCTVLGASALQGVFAGVLQACEGLSAGGFAAAAFRAPVGLEGNDAVVAVPEERANLRRVIDLASADRLPTGEARGGVAHRGV